MSRVFFISDTHFMHHNMISAFRPFFTSTKAMDDALVTAWNATVRDEDTVYHLGDVAYCNSKAKAMRALEVIERLKGKITLVAGNHDKSVVRGSSIWEEVCDYKELEILGEFFILCHYPMSAWNCGTRGAIMLHGHSHGQGGPLPNRIDVGVDSTGPHPVSAETILESLADQNGKSRESLKTLIRKRAMRYSQEQRVAK